MGFWTNRWYLTVLDAEDLFDAPRGGRGTMWAAGVVLAAIPFAYGLRCVIQRHGTLYGRTGGLELRGAEAVALGGAWLAVGIFLHFHYFWGLHRCLVKFSGVGKVVAVLMFVASLGCLIYRLLIVG